MNNLQRHDLSNDLFLVDLILMKLSKMNIDDDVKELVNTAKDRLEKAIDTLRDSIIPDEKKIIPLCRKIVPQVCDDLGLNLEMNINKNNLSKISEKSFRQVVTNIAKNSFEQGATSLNVFLADSCLTFHDNGGGFDSDTLKSLNSGIMTTTKEYGSGHGIESLRQFAIDHDLEMILENSANGAVICFHKKESHQT